MEFCLEYTRSTVCEVRLHFSLIFEYWSLKDVSNCQLHASQTEIYEHLYQETDHNVREFGPKKIRKTPISDNQADIQPRSRILK